MSKLQALVAALVLRYSLLRGGGCPPRLALAGRDCITSSPFQAALTA